MDCICPPCQEKAPDSTAVPNFDASHGDCNVRNEVGGLPFVLCNPRGWLPLPTVYDEVESAV